MARISVADVERWWARLYVAAEGAALRQDDRRRATEVAALLDEIARAVARCTHRAPLVLVDAAAGKSCVGLLSAKLILEPANRDASVVTIERDTRRVAASLAAIERLQSRVPIDCRAAEVADPCAWPARPSLVVALHACGAATDAIIDRVVASRARQLLLVPCCTGRAVEAAARAADRADRWGIPRQAGVRRRFIQAMVDAERTLRLEGAGYETEVVEWVPASVTPHNLLWRSRLVGEPSRMAAARRAASLIVATACPAGPRAPG